ncbi:hypothetical protein HDV63DRAFT_368142, partial [Trichoderma sp. SZMC 28014]
MAEPSNSVVRLLFEFDISKREFVLRFESKTHATAYRALNPEARILEGQPRDVWLPSPSKMSSLRSSSLGMVVIFQSLPDAEKWHKQTCLGGVANFSGIHGGHGVYFNREWSKAELEKRLGIDGVPLTGDDGDEIDSGRTTYSIYSESGGRGVGDIRVGAQNGSGGQHFSVGLAYISGRV